MLYTRKGDDGATKTFACDKKISKSSAIAEALGSLDEINSFLGLCKIKTKDQDLEMIVQNIQESLFIIQAQLAGANKKIEESKVKDLEKIIDEVEKQLPPIKSFFISGGCELAALFDIARTIARRAERRVVAVSEENLVNIQPETLSYLNRLSSVLYALARLSNHKFGIKEVSPSYK